MDDLQLLRGMRNEVGSAPQATLARGREKVMAKVTQPSPLEGKSAKAAQGAIGSIRIRRRILLVTAAAALAGALVGSDVLNLGGAAPVTAHAVDLLNHAADSTLTMSDPPVGEGQYLKLDMTESTTINSEGGLAWSARSTSQLFVPHDRNGEWVMNVGPLEPSEYYGTTTKEKVHEYYAALGLPTPAEPGRQMRGSAGQFLFSENSLSFGNLSPQEAATIPKEPTALCERIKTEIHGTDDSAWSFIAEQLASGVVPAEWRAALYRAAGAIPGATVVEQQATLDGRTGTAIGRTENGVRTDVILDPESGLFIGMRVVNETGNSTIPAGTTTAWTAVKTSITNDAP